MVRGVLKEVDDDTDATVFAILCLMVDKALYKRVIRVQHVVFDPTRYV